MKYLVTYRLLHPEYLPSTSTSEVEAYSHTELEGHLAKILNKWRSDGYTVRVLKVRPVRGAEGGTK